MMLRIINKVYLHVKDELNVCIEFWKAQGKRFVIPGTPTHGNLGDSAIVEAQISFVKKCGAKDTQIVEIDFETYYRRRKLIKKLVHSHDIICSLGGGNMGNVWLREEQFRYDLLEDFPDNRIIIFPQTLYFEKDDDYLNAVEKSKLYYNSHSKLIVFLREKNSYRLFNELYPNVENYLVPDIVLSSDLNEYNLQIEKKLYDILLCFRSDVEVVDRGILYEIIEALKEKNISYNITDTVIENDLQRDIRKELIKAKLEEFKKAKVVITDRLHGMIFSVLVGTPCVVFDNNSHKVSGVYSWVKDLADVKYVNGVNEAVEYVLMKKKYECNEKAWNPECLEVNFNSLINVISCVLDE